MNSIKEGIATVRKHLHEMPISELSWDDGSLTFIVHCNGDNTNITVVVLDVDSYPNSGVMIMSSDPSKENAMSQLAMDHFMDRARLEIVVEKVLKIFVPTWKPGSGTGPPRCQGQGDDSAADAGVASTAEAMACDSRESGHNAEEDGSTINTDDGSISAMEDSPGFSGDSDDDEDRDMIIDCMGRLGRWRQFEEGIEVKELASVSSTSAPLQIFSRVGGFSILSRELIDVRKKHLSNGYIDSYGDDLYTWHVELAGFDPSSQLATDMAEVTRRFAYSSVLLQLCFSRALHPFAPPRVEVLRPRLLAPLPEALAGHPLLMPANWDPWKPLMEVIGQLRLFLEAVAVVDLTNPLNSIEPGASRPDCYTTVEVCAARLAGLTGLMPLCASEHIDIFSMRETYAKDSAHLAALKPSTGKRVCAAEKDGKGRSKKAAKGKAKSVETNMKTGEDGIDEEYDEDEDDPDDEGYLMGAHRHQGGHGWAKGTGYGSGSRGKSVTWDPRAASEVQAHRDQELADVVGELVTALGRDLATGTSGNTSSWPDSTEIISLVDDEGLGLSTAQGAGPSGSSDPNEVISLLEDEDQCLREQGGSRQAGASGQEEARSSEPASTSGQAPRRAPTPGCSLPPHPEVAREVLERSCVLRYLVKEMINVSFADMCSRCSYYSSLIHLLWQAAQPLTSHIFTIDIDGITLLSIIEKLESAATRFEQVVGQEMARQDMSHPPVTKAGTDAAAAARKEASASLLLARRILKLLKRVRELQKDAEGGSSGAEAVAGPSRTLTSDEEYVEAMRLLQVQYPPSLTSVGSHSHSYGALLKNEGVAPRERMLRLARELSGLSHDLPLSPSSSVFVAVDEGNVTLWRALITGPDDTPYAGGCFVFDFYFPPRYPAEPPKVQLITTGGGRVRFNPNLYNCGKVCLSLLGTWSGDKGENWSPEVSTTLQVLISIQSLILVPDPYFNEPGYEGSMGTSKGTQESKAYNQNICINTVRYAMIDILQNPPLPFADIVRQHFRLRGSKILDNIEVWAKENSGLKPLHKELQALIAKL